MVMYRQRLTAWRRHDRGAGARVRVWRLCHRSATLSGAVDSGRYDTYRSVELVFLYYTEMLKSPFSSDVATKAICHFDMNVKYDDIRPVCGIEHGDNGALCRFVRSPYR